MTQVPFDQFSKQYLEDFLTPFGTVQRQYEIPGEAKFVDVWFVPDIEVQEREKELGILGRMVRGMCLLEPYRNAPTRAEIRTSVLKLLWVQEDEKRKAKQSSEILAEANLPQLWILASTVSEPLLRESGGNLKADWLPGIYFISDIFKTATLAVSA
jgi:hypothetical protein